MLNTATLAPSTSTTRWLPGASSPTFATVIQSDMWLISSVRARGAWRFGAVYSRLTRGRVGTLGIAPRQRLSDRVRQLAENVAPLFDDFHVSRPPGVLVGVRRKHEAIRILGKQLAPLGQQLSAGVGNGLSQRLRFPRIGKRVLLFLFLRERDHHVGMGRQDR